MRVVYHSEVIVSRAGVLGALGGLYIFLDYRLGCLLIPFCVHVYKTLFLV